MSGSSQIRPLWRGQRSRRHLGPYRPSGGTNHRASCRSSRTGPGKPSSNTPAAPRSSRHTDEAPFSSLPNLGDVLECPWLPIWSLCTACAGRRGPAWFEPRGCLARANSHEVDCAHLAHGVKKCCSYLNCLKMIPLLPKQIKNSRLLCDRQAKN